MKTETKPTHTPTPKLTFTDFDTLGMSKISIAAGLLLDNLVNMGYSKEKAAYIVRACNNFEPLMNALREGLLLAQETNHNQSKRLQRKFMDVLKMAGDEALNAL